MNRSKNSELSDKKITNKLKVSCDGGSNRLTGHPMVYMEIKPEVGEVTCGYCGRIFIFVEEPFN